ncbi:hypothetical protein BALOs_2544 [Halobacteriovorax sp. BALOs_7]|uniref:hypothetical protein n=1 Tax=Halobacteriovorax sp. BALOs_7 TaxID=2109558 RepID=UPI000EA2F7C6|nr:hypothetical protein [Halobacteriovorax sp. BALOs_7]AYF45538.1 hypothetical protein BALOs_2544 [Halobacteriovorax sp. BALOs_7]
MRTLSVLNKLFTMAIIFSMINLNIAINIEQARFNISSTQAYAQAPEDPAPEGEPERDPQQSSSGGSMESQEVRSNDGTVVLENTQETDTDAITQKRKEMSGTYNKEEASGLFKIFGNGVVAPIILGTIAYITSKMWFYFQPSKPMDIWPAVAGAVILIGNELMSMFKQTESLKDRKSKIEYEGLSEDGTVDVSQQQMLEEEKAILEEMKETAESKAKFQLAAGAAFAIAAGVAAWKQNEQLSFGQLCAQSANAAFLAANATASTALTCGATVGGAKLSEESASCEIPTVSVAEIEALKLAPGPSEVQYKAFVSLIKKKSGASSKCLIGTEAAGKAALAECKATTSSTGGATSGQITALTGAITNLTEATTLMNNNCLIYTEESLKESGEMASVTVTSSNNIKSNNFYTRVLGLLIGKAYAGMGNSLGVLLGLIGAYLVPTGAYMTNFMLSSAKRGWLWLGFSGLAIATSQATKAEAKAIDDNIKKIESILKKFKSAQAVTRVATRNLSKKTTRFAAYQPQKIGTELECVGGLPKIRTNNGSKACPSPEKYLVDGVKGLSNVGFSIPGGFTGAMVDATNGLNGADTISPKTQHAIDVMGKSANAINKQAGKALKKTLERINKQNNGNKGTKRLLASLGKGFNSLNKKAGGKGGLMSALPYLSQPPKQDGEENGDETAGQQDGLAAKAKGGNGIGKYKAPKAEKFKFDFGADDAQAYAAQKHAQFDETAQAVANMEETPDGEIIEDKSVDIWKVISVRYKKTAYDRLLKRIE